MTIEAVASQPAQQPAQPAAQPQPQPAQQLAPQVAPAVAQPVVVPVMASSPALASPAPVSPTAAPAVAVAPQSAAPAQNEPTVASLQAELSTMKAQMELEKVEAAVMAKVKPEHAKAAKAILANLPAQGGVKARTNAALKYFGDEFSEWLIPDQPAASGQPAKAAPVGGAQRSVVQLPQGAPAPASTTPAVSGGITNRAGKRIF